MTEVETVNRIVTSLIKKHRYAVIFLNDDVTTIEFVIFLIQFVFNKSYEEAVNLTLKVHNEGSAIIEIYNNHDVAQAIAEKCMAIARTNGYPLKVLVEEI